MRSATIATKNDLDEFLSNRIEKSNKEAIDALLGCDIPVTNVHYIDNEKCITIGNYYMKAEYKITKEKN